MEYRCFNCNQILTISTNTTIARTEECPNCYSNIRCCKMCVHYDKSAYNECKEPVADRVLEKEKANFCDHYKINSIGAQNNNTEDALAKAQALFKK